MKTKRINSILPAVVLIILCICLIGAFFYIQQELVRVSNDPCFKSTAYPKPNIVIIGKVNVPCKALDVGQIAGIYSSIAALATLLILVCTLAWQSMQMKQTTSLFLTQLEWEKSKLVTESIEKLKNLLSQYKASPPSTLISESQINLDSFLEVIEFSGKLTQTDITDFDFTQPIRSEFVSDKKEIKKLLKLLADLLTESNVIRYSSVDENDRDAISSVVETFS